MTLAVYMPNPLGDDFMDALRENLQPDVDLIEGPRRPDPPDYRILVAGRPKREDVADAPSLEALIIPFAGLPGVTRDRMKAFPRVAVHNLHHNAQATAETAVALLLAAAKQTLRFDRSLREHDWGPRYEAWSAMLLEEKTALVLGYGAVGKRVARAAQGLGMHVKALRRSGPVVETDGVTVHPKEDLHALLPGAHAVVVSLPATAETDGFLGEEEIALLPPGAILVNVGRGPIVEEKALFRALEEKRLSAAGLDVWYRYPASKEEIHRTPVAGHPFHELDNVVMSPHRAGHVKEDMALRAKHLARLLDAASRGEEMPNRVDLERGY